MKCEKWVRLAGQTVVMSLGFALVYTALMWFTSSDEGAAVVSLFPYYLMFGCGLFVMVLGLTAYKSYLPICVSFGCTRRDAMFGLQIMSRLPAMAVTLIAAFISMLLKNDITAGFMQLWFPMFCLLIAAGSVGGIVGCVGVRFGRIGTVFSVLIFVACGFCGGLVGGITAAGGFADISLGLELPTVIAIIAAAIALVLWAVELIVVKIILTKYEVKL